MYRFLYPFRWLMHRFGRMARIEMLLDAIGDFDGDAANHLLEVRRKHEKSNDILLDILGVLKSVNVQLARMQTERCEEDIDEAIRKITKKRVALKQPNRNRAAKNRR
jgi:hypothetical protein